jgi:hypothetical protein
MEGEESRSDSSTLRERAAKWLRLADTLPPGEEADRMRRLAIAYLELTERIEAGLAGARVARRRGEAALRAREE